MDCPQCAQPTGVLEKRPGDRRRRECSICGFRFTTYEVQAVELHALQADRAKLEQLADILRQPAGSELAETRPLDLDLP